MSALRRAVKHTARRALTRRPLPASGERATRVLTYHHFDDGGGSDPFCVAREDFAAQMLEVAERGLARPLDALTETSDPGVLVTIDDGYRSVYTHALPILRDLRIPAVLFVNAGPYADPRVPPATVGADYLGIDELGELAEHGIEIGSHSWSHRLLAPLPAAERRRELLESKAWLERTLGRPIRAFAYPFGTRNAYSAETTREIGEVGYDFGFTSRHGAVRSGDDPRDLPRLKVERDDTISMFRGLLRGGMDVWRHVDRLLWKLQATGS